MVGTPSSKACENCRRRKKKCGEERPECRACIAAGLTCPGFTKRWKFVHENAQLSHLYKDKRYVYEEIDNSYQLSLDSYSRHGPVWSNRQRELVILPSMTFAHDQLISTLVYIMNDPKSQNICQTQCLMSFIDYLPSRLGRNLALDTIVASFCRIHADVLLQSPDTKKRALQGYSKGLRALRTCIEQQELRYESETICASIMLQICETLMNKNQPRWSRLGDLTRGSKHLIAASGIRRYNAPFESAMLHSQQTLYILQDIGNAESSFLLQSQWREMLNALPGMDHAKAYPYLSLRTAFYDILVALHELLSELGPSLTTADERLNAGSRHKRNALRAMNITTTISTWYSKEIEPLIIAHTSSASSDLEEDTPSIADYAPHYPSAFIAVLDCISNLILLKLENIILNLILKMSQWNDHLLFEPRASVNAIRRKSIRASYHFLENHSEHSVQPLSLALQQLCSIDGTSKINLGCTDNCLHLHTSSPQLWSHQTENLPPTLIH